MCVVNKEQEKQLRINFWVNVTDDLLEYCVTCLPPLENVSQPKLKEKNPPLCTKKTTQFNTLIIQYSRTLFSAFLLKV